jgi:hypothetical protein
MNPMLQKALMAVLEWALTGLAMWFVQHGIWSKPDAEQYVTAAALSLLTLGWMLWTRYKDRLKFLVAASSHQRVSEAEVEQTIKDGLPVPSVTTPKNVVPIPSVVKP